MKRSFLLLAVTLLAAACGGGGEATNTSVTTATTPPTTTPASFPVTVEDDNGPVTIEEMPESIVSLSATATEMLFAIGADDQVVAVDDQSNHPEGIPVTDLSAFTPNVEAILSYQPDLVVVYYDPGDLVASLQSAYVPVLYLNAAMTLDDTYRQLKALGTATGHLAEAEAVSESIAAEITAVVDDAADLPEGTTYYHEVDNTFYTATSTTFIGGIYDMFGLENIADPADADGAAAGYPQLSSEYIVSADPDFIFLANALYGESAETVAARPGWDVLGAVQAGNIVELDSDIVSRWGPRIVDFTESVSEALSDYMAQG